MKSNFRIFKIMIVAAAVATIVLSSCVYIPPPSEENRCMLLVSREFEQNTGFKPYVKYDIYIDGKPEPHTRFGPSDYFLLVENLEPGNHRIDVIVADMIDSSGEWEIPNSSAKFKLTDGFVTLLDKTFLVTVEKMEEESKGYTIWYRQDMTIIPLTDERAEAMIADFQNTDKDGMWRISPDH